MNTVVIGFQAWDALTNKPLSRRYHVKDAAEQYVSLVKASVPSAYVKEVYGTGDTTLPGQRRRRS